MLKNYFTIAVRNILRNKLYSFINIVGLAVGIACCIAIMLFVQDELNYDRFNKLADQIYRPTMYGTANGSDIDNAMSPAPMGPTVSHDVSDVMAYTRLYKAGVPMVRHKDKTFSEGRFFWADSTFFDVFTVSFVAGNPKTALTQPNAVVITESTARRYFGDGNPVGKILNVDRQNDYMVTGVIRDVPENSHFRPDFLGSFTTLQYSRDQQWVWNNCYTYFLLRKGAKQSVFKSELMEEVKNHAGPQIRAYFGIALEQLLAAGNRYGYLLQPLTSIHFYSHLDNEIEPNGDMTSVYVFSAIAIAILLIACINFVNLATARSERRAKEVGVRKTLGSTRAYLIRQFISESILMSLAAVVLAVGIVELLLPLFNDIANKKMSLHLFSDPMSIPLLICFAVMVGLVAGSYPAFYLSSFRPIDILRSETKKRGRKSVLRNGLVVFQFAISIALFIGTFVIYAQLQYVQTKELGFNKEATIVINKVGDLSIQVKSFEDELKVKKGIISLTNSTSIPGDRTGDGAYRFADASTDQYQDLRNMSCDYDFAETYQLNVTEGRFFSRYHPSDSEGVVVNESVEKVLGARNIVGRYLVTTGSKPGILKKFQIIGIVKDFNFESLHERIRPLVLSLLPASRYPGRFVTIRLAQGDHLSTISFIENAWKKYAGGEEFSFNFLDNNLQKLYMADQRASKIAGIFSMLAIVVACLGLLGLAAFITEQRTKEIGIRKVLGASVPEVIAIVSAQFAKWVLIANVIAWPLSYYVMNNWLKNFAYRTDMSVWIFIGSGILALVIALATVSSHAIKAATANPIESLRYE